MAGQGAPDFPGDRHAVTMSAPACEKHPPYEQWDAKALIMGTCPVCGHGNAIDPLVASRILRARRLGQEFLPGT